MPIKIILEKEPSENGTVLKLYPHVEQAEDYRNLTLYAVNPS